jgi:hypothetical protein
MYGVRRPKYFNERDRGLQEHTDEKNRLLEAAREEDRLQSLEIALEGPLATTRQETARLKASTRTRRIAKARESALETIGSDFGRRSSLRDTVGVPSCHGRTAQRGARPALDTNIP